MTATVISVGSAANRTPGQSGNSEPLSDGFGLVEPVDAPQALLSEMKLPLSQTFYPLGYAVEVITNRERVLEAAAESFGHRRLCHGATALQVRIGISEKAGRKCPPEPVRRAYGHLFSLVADADNHALLDLSSYTSFAWLSRAALNNRLYFRCNFLEKIVYLLLGASVVTDLRAACVSWNGRGVLLCGGSGSGKSTLAYGCARAGWTYTSDDTSYLINDSPVPRVIGHAHRARFRPSARLLFPELASHELTPRLEGKPSIEVPVSELNIKSTASEATADFVVFLKRSAEAVGALLPLPRGYATERLRRGLYSTGDLRARHEEILEIFCNTPAYELQYCDLEQGIRALEGLVKRGSGQNDPQLHSSTAPSHAPGPA